MIGRLLRLEQRNLPMYSKSEQTYLPGNGSPKGVNVKILLFNGGLLAGEIPTYSSARYNNHF
jgi:hypothetical protein